MGKGYNGKILRVNLNDHTYEIEKKEEEFYRKYLGGRNFIAHFLLKDLEPGIDPLGPENILVFAPGILTGSPIGGTGRNSVGAKSPLTGYYGEAEAGGYFGAELKKAGFDALIIEGKSDKPVYLWIKDEEVHIKDAAELQGKKIAEVQKDIEKETGESAVRTALIGPAGENEVKFASIMNDITHAYGRTGMGAVMGSKNLKGVAVKATNRLEFHDRDKVLEIAKWLNENVDEYCGWAVEMGTPGSVMDHNIGDGLPTRNFNEGSFEGAENISGETMHSTILVGRDTCYACPVRCKQVVEVEEPYTVDKVYGGPEYETLTSFGSMCGVSDLKAVAKANEICNAYTLDTISTGGVIAFSMECFEKGIIDKEDTEGIELTFGNAEAMIELTEQIANREGLGDILADGIRQAAKSFGNGAEKLAVEVKGQSVPYHEPRTKKGTALGYALSPTGADHVHNILDDFYVPGSFAIDEIKALGIFEGLPMEQLDYQKVRMYAYRVMWTSLLNSLVMCLFMPFTYDQQVEMVNAVTGWNTTTFDLAKIGERSINLTRVFNLREGLTPAEDTLPEKMFEVGIFDDDRKVDRKKFKEAVQTYYKMMGWSRKEGKPEKEKLMELDIEWANKYI